jgi:hypothetical protein
MVIKLLHLDIYMPARIKAELFNNLKYFFGAGYNEIVIKMLAGSIGQLQIRSSLHTTSEDFIVSQCHAWN